jgi:hypothetical protein
MKYLSVILLMIVAVSIQAQTTDFTFQGKLNETGCRYLRREISGFDFGTLNPRSSSRDRCHVANVTFVAGVFSVRIDFGGAAFNGEPRWIEIAVSPPGRAISDSHAEAKSWILALRDKVAQLSAGGFGRHCQHCAELQCSRGNARRGIRSDGRLEIV